MVIVRVFIRPSAYVGLRTNVCFCAVLSKIAPHLKSIYIQNTFEKVFEITLHCTTVYKVASINNCYRTTKLK